MWPSIKNSQGSDEEVHHSNSAKKQAVSSHQLLAQRNVVQIRTQLEDKLFQHLLITRVVHHQVSLPALLLQRHLGFDSLQCLLLCQRVPPAQPLNLLLGRALIKQ